MAVTTTYRPAAVVPPDAKAAIRATIALMERSLAARLLAHELALALARMLTPLAPRAGVSTAGAAWTLVMAEKLQDYPADIVLTALDRYSDEATFWPTPVELRRPCQQAVHERLGQLEVLRASLEQPEAALPAPPEPTPEEVSAERERIRELLGGLVRSLGGEVGPRGPNPVEAPRGPVLTETMAAELERIRRRKAEADAGR